VDSWYDAYYYCFTLNAASSLLRIESSYDQSVANFVIAIGSGRYTIVWLDSQSVNLGTGTFYYSDGYTVTTAFGGSFFPSPWTCGFSQAALIFGQYNRFYVYDCPLTSGVCNTVCQYGV
jgi:hypothetical protein